MRTFLLIVLIFEILVVLALVAFLIARKDIYDKFNAVFALNSNIVLIILTIGFLDKRFDMYIDIALSYAILGFVTTVILAKYIGGRK